MPVLKISFFSFLLPSFFPFFLPFLRSLLPCIHSFHLSFLGLYCFAIFQSNNDMCNEGAKTNYVIIEENSDGQSLKYWVALQAVFPFCYQHFLTIFLSQKNIIPGRKIDKCKVILWAHSRMWHAIFQNANFMSINEHYWTPERRPRWMNNGNYIFNIFFGSKDRR